VIGKNHEIVPSPAGELSHPPDLGDPRIRPAQVGERLLARWAEVVRELVVLHESTVDDGHAQIDIEQNCHRLQLADDDVAQNPDERENPLRVRYSSGELAARALPLLEQPLERSPETPCEPSESGAAT